ncbi:DgyrCDS3700 [Dimorphilus gyrociliatus]|uniref:DgyrCDS3700 n=1 Tax=Dimorphilus gyrociliatus TaxID=2664684 RepID=A0A7I8VG29_9ANNE|nr:DgyrCDS3700 [Dimorphilus gyrociliatus]
MYRDYKTFADNVMFFLEPENLPKSFLSESMRILQAFRDCQQFDNRIQSKCVKLFNLYYNDDNFFTGANIQEFFSDCDTITNRDIGEYNFHILYQLYYGGNLECLEKIKYPKLLSVLTKDNERIMPEDPNYRESYINIKKDLKTLSFSDNNIKYMENCLAAVLLLGELRISNKNSNLQVIGPVEDAAKLLDMSSESFIEFISYEIFDREEKVLRSSYNATSFCLKLARTLYKQLSKWVVNKINDHLKQHLSSVNHSLDNYRKVSIMDSPPLFQDCHSTSLWKFLSNARVENMNYIYNKHVFKDPQDSFKAKFPWTDIVSHYENDTFDLLFNKNNGLLKRLRDISNPESSSSSDFKTELRNVKNKQIILRNNTQFGIKHFLNDEASYDCKNFIELNKDYVLPNEVFSDFIGLCNTSEIGRMCEVFKKSNTSFQKSKVLLSASDLRTQKLEDALKEILPEFEASEVYYLCCVNHASTNEEKSLEEKLKSFSIEQLTMLKKKGFRTVFYDTELPMTFNFLPRDKEIEGIRKCLEEHKDSYKEVGTAIYLKTMALRILRTHRNRIKNETLRGTTGIPNLHEEIEENEEISDNYSYVSFSSINEAKLV